MSIEFRFCVFMYLSLAASYAFVRASVCVCVCVCVCAGLSLKQFIHAAELATIRLILRRRRSRNIVARTLHSSSSTPC